MDVSFKLTMGMVLFHAHTMKELRIDKVIEQCYNEDSREYKELCKEYTEIVGFKREENVEEFDKELMKILAEQAVTSQKEVVGDIEKVVKTCYLKGATGFLSFGGYLINPRDFCAIRINNFDIKISKK